MARKDHPAHQIRPGTTPTRHQRTEKTRHTSAEHAQVVVSSNFTSALDVLGSLAERNAWGFLRLDGGTPTNARQSMVDRFNKAPPEDLFLFFLSAKAGGVGLNL